MNGRIIRFSEVETKVLSLRGKQVIIDSDVAQLYGVQTKRVNEAVKNNPEKFPTGYVFELTKEEKLEVVENFDHLLKLKYSSALPYVFTEKGLYMLATILKSELATQTTIVIVETFAKLKELSRTVSSLSTVKEEGLQKTLMQKGGEIIFDLLGEDQKITDTETTIELNYAVLKLKHTFKRKSDSEHLE